MSVPQINLTDYQKKYNACQAALAEKDLCPCEKLQRVEMCEVALNQEKYKYWPRFCLRGWPFLGIWEVPQHKIDELTERLHPVKAVLKTQCHYAMQRKNQEALAATVASHTDAQSRGTGMSASAGRDFVISFGLPSIPAYSEEKK